MRRLAIQQFSQVYESPPSPFTFPRRHGQLDCSGGQTVSITSRSIPKRARRYEPQNPGFSFRSVLPVPFELFIIASATRAQPHCWPNADKLRIQLENTSSLPDNCPSLPRLWLYCVCYSLVDAHVRDLEDRQQDLQRSHQPQQMQEALCDSFSLRGSLDTPRDGELQKEPTDFVSVAPRDRQQTTRELEMIEEALCDSRPAHVQAFHLGEMIRGQRSSVTVAGKPCKVTT